MPFKYGLCSVYVHEGRVVRGRPVHDDAGEWVRRLERDNVLAARGANLVIGKGDAAWTAMLVSFKTAAVLTWVHQRRIESVGLVLSGVRDQADYDAGQLAGQAADLLLPPRHFDGMRRKAARPALLMVGANQDVFTNRMVNTVSMAVAQVLLARAKAQTPRPPLERVAARPRDAAFGAVTVSPEGQIGSAVPHSLSSVDRDGRYHEMLAFFGEHLADAVGQCRATVGMVTGKWELVWQPFGKTAGVVTMQSMDGDDGQKAVLLLLTGLDVADDHAAVAAYAKHVGTKMNDAWSKSFASIGRGRRPLAVRFVTNEGQASEAGEMVGWCFAAAFFRHKQVL